MRGFHQVLISGLTFTQCFLHLLAPKGRGQLPADILDALKILFGKKVRARNIYQGKGSAIRYEWDENCGFNVEDLVDLWQKFTNGCLGGGGKRRGFDKFSDPPLDGFWSSNDHPLFCAQHTLEKTILLKGYANGRDSAPDQLLDLSHNARRKGVVLHLDRLSVLVEQINIGVFTGKNVI